MELPVEIVHRIQRWICEFHRRDAMNRVAGFAALYGSGPWDIIMNDIRANVPRYSVTVQTRSGYVLPLSVFSPDCNPVLWDDRALGSSFLRFRRRALACGESRQSL